MTLSGLLRLLRLDRGFDVADCLSGKIRRINTYFTDCGLDSAVIGVSGGVDSAAALALLMAASRAPESPIRRVVGLLVPIGGRGATTQGEATTRGDRVIAATGAEGWHCDLTAAQQAFVAAISPHGQTDAWAEGQLLSVVRTPAFYYAAAMLQAEGFRSLVVGTTNRDEGAYLGFFGKASDGMVDLQPLSDLHKSEVCALARQLSVPSDITDAVPRGDVYDGRVDEEMIGAPYWFVELYLMMRCRDATALLAPLSAQARARYNHYAAAIEELHRHNAHKYRVGSPAIHLDVYPRAVPGGWS